MSDKRTNATVIPFVIGDETDADETGGRTPTERPSLAEVVRMAEAIVFASAEPVSEGRWPRAFRKVLTSPPRWRSCNRPIRNAA